MLHRVVYVSETVGSVGASTLSLAQILGVSDRNNRRDHITSGVAFLDGWCIQGVEGARGDVDRLMRRLREDRRHSNLRVIIDKPVAERAFPESMALCDDPAAMLKKIGGSTLADITANDVERMVEVRRAA